MIELEQKRYYIHNVDVRTLKLRKSIQLFVRWREHTGSEKKKSIHKFFVSRCRYLSVNVYGSRWKLVLRSGSLGEGIWLGHWLEISGWLFALRSEQIVRSIFWRKTHLLLLLRLWWWYCLKTHFSHGLDSVDCGGAFPFSNSLKFTRTFSIAELTPRSKQLVTKWWTKSSRASTLSHGD